MARLEQIIRRFPFHIVSGIVLLALIALAVPLRLSSMREVSDVQLERTQGRLRQATRSFVEEFDREITRAVIYFAVSSSDNDRKLTRQLAKRLNHWRSHSPHPRLVRGLFLQQGPRLSHAPLFEFDPITGRPELVDWPARFDPIVEPVAHHSEQRDQPGAAFRDEIPALVLPLLPAAEKDQVASTDTGIAVVPEGHIIIELDLGYVTQELLPSLVERHFSIGDGVVYQAIVLRRTDPPSAIYKSNDGISLADFSTPDVSAYVFDLLFEPQYRALLLNVGLSLGMLIPESEEAQADFAAAQVPPSVLSEGQSDYGRWQVLVRHPAGSLPAAFENERRRNAALSIGLFGLLGATAILLLVSTQRAQKLASQQIEFVAGVSHELRTPLSVIRMASRNLEHGAVRNEEAVKRYAALIGSEERRLSEMVERVLAFGQMQRGEKAFAMEKVSVRDIVELAVSDCAPLIEERQAEVEPHYPIEELFALGDGEALRQAIQNLIANAIKHSGDHPRVSIAVEADDAEGDLVLVVRDRGSGIHSEDLPHIFEPFFRGKGAVAEQIQGSGLGLTLVKEIVDAHRGRVTVKSDESGSVFTLHLPMPSRIVAAPKTKVEIDDVSNVSRASRA